MPFWRRDEEPAHERLARDGGIDLERDPTPVPDPFLPQQRTPFVGAIREPGIHGIHRPRQWDGIAVAEAPDLQADEVRFVTLPDGTLLVDDAVPDGALAPLADAIEQELSPPYRARAVRRDGGVWAVAANQIVVLEAPDEIRGDTVSLAVQGEERTLLIDDRPAWDAIPTFEAHAAAQHRDFVLHAERLEGDLWDVRVNPL